MLQAHQGRGKLPAAAPSGSPCGIASYKSSTSAPSQPPDRGDWYSNFVPTMQSFEDRLSDRHLFIINSAVMTRRAIVGSPIARCVALRCVVVCLQGVDGYMIRAGTKFLHLRRLKSASWHLAVEGRVLCTPEVTSELCRVVVNGSPP